jgi:hypothetical protein
MVRSAARPRVSNHEAAYFFSASASTFGQAGVSLSFDLARQAMILPPPGCSFLCGYRYCFLIAE